MTKELLASVGLLLSGMMLMDVPLSAAQPKNLLKNGGFEEGDAHWGGFRNARIAQGEGRNGSACLSISNDDPAKSHGFWAVGEWVNIDPAVEHTIQAWMKTEGPGLFYVRIWCGNKESAQFGLLTPVKEDFVIDSWHRRIAYVKLPPEAVKARVVLEMDHTGTVWFDDLSLTPGRFEDPASELKPKAVIKANHATIHLGQWIEFDGSGSTCVEGRQVVGFNFQLPTFAGRRDGVGIGSEDRRLKYGWQARREGKLGERLLIKPTHLGKFRLGLTVFDSLGVESLSTELGFEVRANQPPKAAFDWQLLPDGNVELDASKSSDPDGKVAACLWEFPDGQVKEGVRVTHGLEPPEDANLKTIGYTVRLVARDGHGLEGVAERDVAIARSARRGSERPTLREAIEIEVGTDSLRLLSTPKQCKVRLGFREYVPVRFVNHGPDTQRVVATPLGAEKNVFVRGFEIEVKKNAEAAVEIQSLLFCDTEIKIGFGIAGRKIGSLEIPLRLKVEETMPLFGTQESLSRIRRLPSGEEKVLVDITKFAELPCQLLRFSSMPDETLRLGRTPTAAVGGSIWGTKQWEDLRDGKTEGYAERLRRRIRGFKDKTDYWESYNEPPWNRNVTAWGVEPLTDAMWNMMETFHRVVKEEDPTAKVIMPGWALGAPGGKMCRVVENLSKRGVHKIVDVYCFHDYTCTRRLPLEKEIAVAWKRYDEASRARTEWMRGLMEQYGGAEKSLWINECGGFNVLIDERQKAMQWLRFVAQCVGLGVNGIFQYEFYDYPHDPCHGPMAALMRATDYYPTMHFRAYHELIHYLTGAEVDGPMDLGQDIVALAFHRGNERIYCTWSNASKNKDIRIPIDASRLVEVNDVLFTTDGNFVRKRRLAATQPNIGLLRFSLKPLEFRIVSVVNVD